MISLVGPRTLLLLACSLALACGDGEAVPPGPVPMPPGRAPTYDAGAPDAGGASLTTCCRLDNAQGERLDYKCSTALDVDYLEARDYRCWLVE